MNPDKLFDYLDGRLPAAERAALEERLISDKQLQREFGVARQIHAGIRGDSREIILPPSPDVSEQGHKMAIRIGVAFMVLMFVNVGIGLWFIFKHESSNPNRPLLEAQMREQIAKSIERAATLTHLVGPQRKVFRIEAASVFSLMCRQVGSWIFATRLRLLVAKYRRRRRPVRRNGDHRPRLQLRKRTSLCRSSRSSACVSLAISRASRRLALHFIR